MSKAKSSKKSGKGQGIVRIVLVLAAIAFFTYTSIVGLGPNGSGALDRIKLGLDLAGGVSITYQATDENVSATDMSDTQYKLLQRAQSYSNEAEVYPEGGNRINVDIPDVTDANAILADLGNPGSLVFKDEAGNTVLEGTDVAGAVGYINDKYTTAQDHYLVQLTLTDEGTRKFSEATAANIGKRISIIYDGKVVSDPVVQTAITQSTCEINGLGSYEEAARLATTIRIGALPLQLEEIRSTVVGAKLGEEAISTSLKAAVIGFILVAVFMIAVYGIMGVAADLALALYIGLVIFLLGAFEVTMTLPGIAGIILGIGMAVDANVIIFARIREELRAGKSVDGAIKGGFHKALSAIIDGNVTTLIAAAILFALAFGTIRGFAQTLAVGIVVSMFTALFVTRFALRGLYLLGAKNPKLYGFDPAKTKEPKIIDFIGKRKIFLAISIVVILAGLATIAFRGLNYSLEFSGGTSTSVTFSEEMTRERIDSELVPLVSGITGDNDIQYQQVLQTSEQQSAGEYQVVVRTRTLSVDERLAMQKALEEKYNIDAEKITAETIGAVVSGEMRRTAVISVIVATLAMLIYIWFRFKDIRFAASSVLALVHDVLVVLTFYAVLRWTVGNTFIACMLTIVGYSINATIVVFDRIRENLKLYPRDGLKEIVNRSVTQTLWRSVNSSLTTFIMVLMLFIFGVASIREFALPLMVGILCGTYSSVCMAGAMWYMMHKNGERIVKND